MSVPVWKIHAKFNSYWQEYKNAHLLSVCKSILILMNLKPKGNILQQVRNHWANVCNFLAQWEGNHNS